MKRTSQHFNRRRQTNKPAYTIHSNKITWNISKRSQSNSKLKPSVMNQILYKKNKQGLSQGRLDNNYSQTCLSFNPQMKRNSESKKRAITPSSNKILIQNERMRMQVSRNSAVEDISKGVGPGGQPNYEKYEKLNTIVDQCNDALTGGPLKEFDFMRLENQMYTDTIKETMNVIREIESSQERNMMKIYLWKKHNIDNQKLVESEVIKEFRSANLDPRKYGSKKKKH